MGVGGQRHAPAALTPGKSPGTHCTGGRVGRRAGLEGCGRISPPPGFDPRAVQPVGSHYTDRAIQALPAWTFGQKKKSRAPVGRINDFWVMRPVA